ncbi:MAG: HlyD family efflux transporter periplasmic adaptor subunit [Lutimonas sp.]
MRKSISIVIGILLLLLTYFGVKYMISSNQKPTLPPKINVNSVFVQTVENKDVAIQISASGNIVAKNKIELYSEVQGVLVPLSKEFKPGTSYQKGETILKIDNQEHLANLQAQKSNLFNSIASIMPDLRLDYPNEFQKWEQYLNLFDFDKSTPPLPETNSDKEKFFISGRNIYTTYYNVKNLEVRLSKYAIRAPFNGILTEALVNQGTLIRQGQKLGEFIDPSNYEMEIAINANYKDLMQVGKTVDLHDLEKTKSWQGKVVRINGKIDQASQTLKVFIQVAGEGLKEGMYLEADLQAKTEQNAFEISRKLLVNNENVYQVKDTVLMLTPVRTVYFSDQTAVIKGLENGTKILSKPVPGAYDGMVVKVIGNTSNQNK